MSVSLTATGFGAAEQALTFPPQTPLLLSAEFDYARIPAELWRQRIILARSTGFNALTIPVFWSYHEPEPGFFLFDSQWDIAGLLDLCRNENMAAIVRIGPRLDGDWELGGLPPWAMARTVHPRTYDHEFLAALDQWFGRLVPLLAARQTQRGGAVIMIEVERGNPNEPNRADPAFADYLRQRLRSLAIEVPIVSAPEESPDKPFAYALSDGPLTGPARRAVLRLGRARPWGESDVTLDRSMEALGLLARGARWLDCRSFFGGTNFGFQAAEGLPARHDCGAPVGEAGDLRPTYYALKQWLCWARSAEPLLVGSSPEPTSNTAIGPQRFPGWRFSSPAGQLLFIERRPGTAWSATVRLGDSSPMVERIEFEPRGVWPIVRHWTLSDVSTALGILPMTVLWQDSRSTITVEAGAAKMLYLGKVAGRRLLVAADRRTSAPRITIHGQDADATSGSRIVQMVSVSENLFARTWPFATARGNAALIGGDALLDVAISPSKTTQLVVGCTSFPAELRLYAAAAHTSTSRGTAAFSEKDRCWIIRTGPADPPPPPPSLAPWQQRDDNRAAQLSCDVSSWTSGSEPLTVEHLPAPIDSPHAWYRTTLDVPAFSTYTLRVGGIGDRATVFINGWHLGSLDGAATDEATFLLPGGPMALSLLVEHDGRDDCRRDDWPIPDHCFKGLRAPVVVAAGSERAPISFWQFVINNRGPEDVRKIMFSDSGAESWQILWPGPDDMNHQAGFAWYRFGGDPRVPRFCYPAPRQGMLELRLPPVDDHAWVYLDGQLVGTHDDSKRGRLIRVPDTMRARHQTTSHSLAVLVENRRGPGGMTGPVRVGLASRGAEIRHGPWYMRVGLTGERDEWFTPSRLAVESAAWSDVTTPTRQTVVRWYRTRFSYFFPGQVDNLSYLPAGQVDDLSYVERAETFFLHLGSLKRGVAWLNGHCLGRYRSIGCDAERGLCLPSCWLDRENWIVVAETDGGLPDGARLTRDAASHYYLTTLRIEP